MPRLSFSDTALLESSTEVLQAMGVSRAALDIEMPTYTSSQDTLSQDSRWDKLFNKLNLPQF